MRKLRGARERKREQAGKVEGRKSHAERDPELVAVAHELSEQRPRLSLRKISAELAARGFTIGRGPKERAEGAPIGRPYAATAVASMLAGPFEVVAAA